MLARRILAMVCLGVLVAVLAAPAVSATTYTVDADPYTATNAVSVTDTWDTYELTASAGQSIAYSVSAAGGGCVMLLFIKGHSVTVNSQYYVAYSQANCVSSYSNTFPVASADGTDFSVLITTTNMSPVTYTVNINTTGGGLGSLLYVLLALIVVIVVVAVIVVVLVRRRKPPTSMAPPPYVPSWQAQPPQGPAGLPEQPPQQPLQPPLPPP